MIGVLRELDFEAPPKQIEFARLNLTNTMMSKRYLKQLVDNKNVNGWDDPRMPTIAGLRRRGFTPEAIRDFCDRIGVAKSNSTVDIALLEHCIREDLKEKVEMKMVILEPLMVTITNYPEDKTEWIDIENNKEVEAMGERKVLFSNRLFIEKSDFLENPPKKFFRMFPGNEVRFKGAYFLKCEEVIKDENGEVIELKCTYDPETKSGSGFTGRKVKGTIHWVNARDAVNIKVNAYEYLMVDNEDGESVLNPDSLITYNAMAEASIKEANKGDKYQFFRHGYYYADPSLTSKDGKVFNRIVSLKTSYNPQK